MQNVGLEDKVGALTALRLLKADDTLLQRLLKEGILPPLLAIRAGRRGRRRRLGRGSVVAGAGAAHLRLVRAETGAAAARAVEAFSSSGDSLTTLLRGGAVEALSEKCCAARGASSRTPRRRASSARRRKRSRLPRWERRARRRRRRATPALARISGSNLASPRIARPVRERL